MRPLYFDLPPSSIIFALRLSAEAFLSTLLTSLGSKSSHLNRIISSLAQDLVYNASFGRKRVQKHVQLGICVKRKSRSVDLIRWLNHYGHTISYNEINSIETKLAEDQANRREPRKFVPNNIESSFFVTFVCDNCDHKIESIYDVTLHGTNGVIIKKCLRTTSNDISTNPPVKNVHRRSFKPVSNELQPYIKTKARLNSIAIPIVDTGVNGFLTRFGFAHTPLRIFD